MKNYDQAFNTHTYIQRYLPSFEEICLDYQQCLKELDNEAHSLAARYGLHNEQGQYPAWMFDRLFGD